MHSIFVCAWILTLVGAVTAHQMPPSQWAGEEGNGALEALPLTRMTILSVS